MVLAESYWWPVCYRVYPIAHIASRISTSEATTDVGVLTLTNYNPFWGRYRITGNTRLVMGKG